MITQLLVMSVSAQSSGHTAREMKIAFKIQIKDSKMTPRTNKWRVFQKNLLVGWWYNSCLLCAHQAPPSLPSTPENRNFTLLDCRTETFHPIAVAIPKHVCCTMSLSLHVPCLHSQWLFEGCLSPPLMLLPCPDTRGSLCLPVHLICVPAPWPHINFCSLQTTLPQLLCYSSVTS